MSASRVSVRRLLAGTALALAVWAVVISLTGGVSLTIGGLRLSSRAALRPALAALVLMVAALWGTTPSDRRRGLAQARTLADRVAPGLAVAVALGALVLSTVFNEHVSGGADSSGYLSQSRLWAAGRLDVEARTITDEPWPFNGWVVSPLGYAPAATEGRIGPSYAPGLPWLMAAGAAVFGEAGRYLWTPIATAALAWLTFAFTRRQAPPAVAFAATVLVATSPPVLFASMQTMSDLLCAAAFTAMLVASTQPTAGAALVAGACGALALVVRPNLAFAAGAVWAASAIASPLPWSARLRRGVVMAVPLALAAIAIAWINDRVWGSPFSSGYGATADLFSASFVGQNAARLWQWTGETGAYWLVAAVPALLWAVWRGPRVAWGPAAALTVGVVGSYLPYAVFAEWWYFRFYLAAWPMLAAAVAVAVWQGLRRIDDDGAVLAVLALGLVIGTQALRTAQAQPTFDLWRGAQRYPAVAAWVETEAPAGAVLLSVQHSGALADGTSHTIARWDYVAPDGLDVLVESLAAGGRAAWLVADDFEEPLFRARFAASARGALEWAPLAEARIAASRVRIYDLTTPARATAPALIRVLYGGPWPWARQWHVPAPK